MQVSVLYTGPVRCGTVYFWRSFPPRFKLANFKITTQKLTLCYAILPMWLLGRYRRVLGRNKRPESWQTLKQAKRLHQRPNPLPTKGLTSWRHVHHRDREPIAARLIYNLKGRWLTGIDRKVLMFFNTRGALKFAL